MEQVGAGPVAYATYRNRSTGVAATLAIFDDGDGPVGLEGQLFGVDEGPPAQLHATIDRATIGAVDVQFDGKTARVSVNGQEVSTELRLNLIPIEDSGENLAMVGMMVDDDDTMEVVVLDDPTVVITLIVVGGWVLVCLGKHLINVIAADRADARRIAAGMDNTEIEIETTVDGEPDIDLSIPQRIKARLKCKGRVRVGPRRERAERREYAFAD